MPETVVYTSNREISKIINNSYKDNEIGNGKQRNVGKVISGKSSLKKSPEYYDLLQKTFKVGETVH